MQQAQNIIENCNKAFRWKQINKGPHSCIWTDHKIKTIQVFELKKKKRKGFPKSSALCPASVLIGYSVFMDMKIFL